MNPELKEYLDAMRKDAAELKASLTSMAQRIEAQTAQLSDLCGWKPDLAGGVTGPVTASSGTTGFVLASAGLAEPLAPAPTIATSLVVAPAVPTDTIVVALETCSTECPSYDDTEPAHASTRVAAPTSATVTVDVIPLLAATAASDGAGEAIKGAASTAERSLAVTRAVPRDTTVVVHAFCSAECVAQVVTAASTTPPTLLRASGSSSSQASSKPRPIPWPSFVVLPGGVHLTEPRPPLLSKDNHTAVQLFNDPVPCFVHLSSFTFFQWEMAWQLEGTANYTRAIHAFKLWCISLFRLQFLEMDSEKVFQWLSEDNPTVLQSLPNISIWEIAWVLVVSACAHTDLGGSGKSHILLLPWVWEQEELNPSFQFQQSSILPDWYLYNQTIIARGLPDYSLKYNVLADTWGSRLLCVIQSCSCITGWVLTPWNPGQQVVLSDFTKVSCFQAVHDICLKKLTLQSMYHDHTLLTPHKPRRGAQVYSNCPSDSQLDVGTNTTWYSAYKYCMMVVQNGSFINLKLLRHSDDIHLELWPLRIFSPADELISKSGIIVHEILWADCHWWNFMKDQELYFLWCDIPEADFSSVTICEVLLLHHQNMISWHGYQHAFKLLQWMIAWSRHLHCSGIAGAESKENLFPDVGEDIIQANFMTVCYWAASVVAWSVFSTRFRPTVAHIHIDSMKHNNSTRSPRALILAFPKVTDVISLELWCQSGKTITLIWSSRFLVLLNGGEQGSGFHELSLALVAWTDDSLSTEPSRGVQHTQLTWDPGRSTWHWWLSVRRPITISGGKHMPALGRHEEFRSQWDPGGFSVMSAWGQAAFQGERDVRSLS